MENAQKISVFRDQPKQRGLTLPEILMVSVLIALLAFALFSLLSAVTNLARVQALRAESDHGGVQIFRTLAREIAESSPREDGGHLILETDAAGNSVVRFQVPVVWDLNGDAKWGAYRTIRETRQQPWLNGWVRYRIVGQQLIREVLSPVDTKPVATDVLIPQDVQSLHLTKNGRQLSIVLQMKKTDLLGQKGPASRTYQTTFDMNVLLRNEPD